MRLDIYMAQELQTSRSQSAIFIKKNGITINKELVFKPSFLVGTDDEITYTVPEVKEAVKEEYIPNLDFDVDIIYEDDELLVVNKPPHLVVHPAPSVKEPTLVDWLKSKNIKLSNINNEVRSGIVHRIDKQTSGALIVAKTNSAHEFLSAQLQDKSMGRYYIAMLDLPLKEDTVVESYLARNLKNRLKVSSNKKEVKNSRYAKSAFTKLLLSKDEKKELIAAKLFTGRTHQIRAHLESLARHILGDELYGFKSKISKINPQRVMLHAYLLYFIHPKTKEQVLVKAPILNDFSAILNKNFGIGSTSEILKSSNIINSFNL
ncbi:MAG: Ribosomal large subunit pseudouridine synthase D (EC [uncultured Campylobacterales bacterium]|uniref:Pseudouridine synthase n=1 Tax=uncultured Campylobacterales bacterium TaxID=352960 RepID=A0A6S6T7E9_9BACT|nr:MAG: Ribosomal large subunit pseudouridine synthase D (EC [uncultured Campylobacterales bacterium]